MKREHDGGWTAGPQDAASGSLAYSSQSGRARALSSVWMALAPLTKGERGDSVKARDGRDFQPWVYALAAIRWQRKIPVYAMICRAAFVRELHHHSEDEREILLCDENRFADFIGKALVDKMREHGSDEIAAVNSLLERVESKARSETQEERDFLRAVEAATESAGDVPTREDVRERWKAGRKGRTAKQFRRVLEAIGFDWLPSNRVAGFSDLLE